MAVERSDKPKEVKSTMDALVFVPRINPIQAVFPTAEQRSQDHDRFPL